MYAPLNREAKLEWLNLSVDGLNLCESKQGMAGLIQSDNLQAVFLEAKNYRLQQWMGSGTCADCIRMAYCSSRWVMELVLTAEACTIQCPYLELAGTANTLATGVVYSGLGTLSYSPHAKQSVAISIQLRAPFVL